jgi:hypothetical protein
VPGDLRPGAYRQGRLASLTSDYKSSVGVRMKSAIRLVIVLGTMAFTALMSMPWAFAQKEYETPPTLIPTSEPKGEVAFTGFRLTLWVALLVALVAIGAFALWAGRRRASEAKHTA